MQINFLEVLEIIFKLSSILGLGFLIWYACETYRLRKTAEKQLVYSLRPYISFLMDPKEYTIKNSSENLALNLFLVTKLNGQYEISDESEHLTALEKGAKYTFTRSKMRKITPTELIGRVPSVSNLVHLLKKRETNCLVVVYEDLNKNKLYTISNGTGGALDQAGDTNYVNIS